MSSFHALPNVRAIRRRAAPRLRPGAHTGAVVASTATLASLPVRSLCTSDIVPAQARPGVVRRLQADRGRIVRRLAHTGLRFPHTPRGTHPAGAAGIARVHGGHPVRRRAVPFRFHRRKRERLRRPSCLASSCSYWPQQHGWVLTGLVKQVSPVVHVLLDALLAILSSRHRSCRASGRRDSAELLPGRGGCLVAGHHGSRYEKKSMAPTVAARAPGRASGPAVADPPGAGQRAADHSIDLPRQTTRGSSARSSRRERTVMRSFVTPRPEGAVGPRDWPADPGSRRVLTVILTSRWRQPSGLPGSIRPSAAPVGGG